MTKILQEIKKPVFRQSEIQNYFVCPKKYKLSKDIDLELDKMALRKGLIFENYVLGNKSDHDEEEFQKETIGRITKPTLDFMRSQAEKAKEYFGAGESFIKLNYESENYILQGEADFIGQVKYEEEFFEAIGDLKYTSNINEFWNKREKKSDYIQAIVYSFLLWKITGKLLPFIFIIVETTYKDPLIKTIKIDIQENDFQWLKMILDMIRKDIFFQANQNENTCLGWRGYGKCDYLEFCFEGREFICSPVNEAFSNLLEWQMDD